MGRQTFICADAAAGPGNYSNNLPSWLPSRKTGIPYTVIVIKDQDLFDRLKAKYCVFKFCKDLDHIPSLPRGLLTSCEGFEKLNKVARVNCIVKNYFCLMCLSCHHVKDNCQACIQACISEYKPDIFLCMMEHNVFSHRIIVFTEDAVPNGRDHGVLWEGARKPFHQVLLELKDPFGETHCIQLIGKETRSAFTQDPLILMSSLMLALIDLPPLLISS